jgi:GT2 family glycosyltransferase
MATTQKTDPTGSIIILNYKTNDLVLQLIQKLSPADNWHIIVVDNSPDTDIQHNIPPQVQYMSTGKNLGYAGGNNVGIKASKGEWVLIANSDIEISIDQINTLVKEAENNNSSIVAPLLISKDGSKQQSAGYFDSFFANPVNSIFARPRFIAPINNENMHVDLVTGACILVKKHVFDTIGMFDDKTYFMYFEDIDWSLRLKKEGIPILYVPSVRVIHYGGASSDQDARQKNTNYQQGLKNYIRKHRGVIIEKINELCGFFK